MDLSKLSDTQLQIAEMVIAEAERQKIDPNLALAVAYQESKLDPKASSQKGAYGVMQLMPNTAKELGVNPLNVDENIRGGVSYLKSNLNRFDNNPLHAVAAYNAGPNSRFLQTKDFKDLPEETLGYIESINTFYPLERQQEVEVGTEATPTTAQAINQEEPFLWGVGGAGVGYAKGRAEQAYNQRRGVIAPTPEKPVGSAGERWAQKTGYGSGQGSVREVSERYQKQFRDIGEGKRSIKGGRLWNVDQALEEIRRKEELAKRAVPTKVAENVGRFASHFPKLSGTLGGLGVGAEGAEAYNRYQKGDYPGMVISGLGALGSAASLLPATSLPTAVAKGAGTIVGALSPAVLYGYDYLKEKLD